MKQAAAFWNHLDILQKRLSFDIAVRADGSLLDLALLAAVAALRSLVLQHVALNQDGNVIAVAGGGDLQPAPDASDDHR